MRCERAKPTLGGWRPCISNDVEEPSIDRLRLRGQAVKDPAQTLGIPFRLSLGYFKKGEFAADARCFRRLLAESAHCFITLMDMLPHVFRPVWISAHAPGAVGVQFLELIFVQCELMPAGLEQRRAAEPVVGFLYYIGGIY